MKKILALILCLMLVISLTACNGTNAGKSDTSQESSAASESSSSSESADSSEPSESGEEAVINWVTQTGDSTLDIMTAWDDETDGISLNIETASGNDVRTLMATKMATNDMPDIFYYWSMSSLTEFIANGLLADIDEYFNRSETISRSDFSEDDMKAMSRDGGTAYGVPIGGSSQLLAANMDLFNEYDLEVPTTYEELKDVAAVFNENGIIPISCGSSHGDIGYFLWSSILYQYTSFDEVLEMVSGKDQFANNEGAIKASEYILEMASLNMFPKDTVGSGDFAGTLALYNAGQAAMLTATTWYVADITVENTEFYTYPEFPGAVNDPTTFTTGGPNNGFYVSKAGWETKADAITAFMDYYLSDEVQWIMYENGRSCKIMDEYPASLSEGILGKFREKWLPLDLNMAQWAIMTNTDSREIYMDNMDSLFANSTTAEEFLGKVQDAVNKDLDKLGV